MPSEIFVLLLVNRFHPLGNISWKSIQRFISRWNFRPKTKFYFFVAVKQKKQQRRALSVTWTASQSRFCVFLGSKRISLICVKVERVQMSVWASVTLRNQSCDTFFCLTYRRFVFHPSAEVSVLSLLHALTLV